MPTKRPAPTPSQRLLLTLLGEHWPSGDEFVPSAALLDALAVFGITAAGGRAALSRVGRSGALELSRSGRRTAYRLSAPTRGAVEWVVERIVRFTTLGLGDDPSDPAQDGWDGEWTTLSYSLASLERGAHGAVRDQLRRLGFAALYDGVWVCPHDRGEAALQWLATTGVADTTTFRGRASATSSRAPEAAYDLRRVQVRYETLLGRFEPVLERARAGTLTPDEALAARTQAMDSWQWMPFLDPALPGRLLPVTWPGWQARRAFAELFATLADPAVEALRAIVAPHSEPAAEAISCRSLVAAAA